MRAFFFKLRTKIEAASAGLSQSAKRDLMVLGLVGLGAYLVSVSLDLFDSVIHFLETHEELEVDEIVMAAIIMSVAVIIFAVRRMRESVFNLELRVAAEDDAKALAMHDALTGLPNRRRLEAELQEIVAGGEHVAVVIADLDRFKPVNDLYGHAAGDALLVHLAEKVSKEIDPRDFLSRIGGDEFVLVLRNAGDSEALIRRLTHLTASFEAPASIGDLEVSVGATMGVAVSADAVTTPSEFLRRADIALYRAKEDGRGRFAFFEAAMDVRVQARLELERKLRTAIARNEVEPFFQPLVLLQTGEVYGYEVLARMRGPDGALVMPDQFIHLAEEIGLIGEMTMNLLRRSCIETRDWPGAPLISVNISPVQLRDPNLPQKILKILTETGFPAARLQVEITENALVDDFDLARTTLLSFRNQGVRIALDDFGTGYSSLRHLRELPFDNLKIDRSFVQHMDDDDEARTIVRTIVDLAKNLGLALTAEGIESSDNAATLRAIGCETGQGYWYGRPASADEIRAQFADAQEPANQAAVDEKRKGAA